MLEFIVTWTAGLLIWANMLLWGFVVFVSLLPLIIGLISSIVRGATNILRAIK